MSILLGIDVGTSSTKAVVIDDRGGILGVASADHPSSTPLPGWSEQIPQDWWRSACEAVGRALAQVDRSPADVRGVGLSGQMHGSVLMDARTLAAKGERDDVLRPAILWNDQRTAEQCRWIEDRAGGRAALVQLVGNAALPGFTLPKWLWVREREPELWARVAVAMMPKDYVRFRMTGQAATDVGDGAGTLLLDVDQRAWSQRAVDLFGIDPAILPAVLESGQVAGHLTGPGAAAMGLREGTPVVAGSGDNQCGAIGAGVVRSGMVLATLGTSGVVYAHADEPRRDLTPESPGRVHTMCAADGGGSLPRGHYSITGCTLSAGGALAWAREHVFGGADYAALMREAASAPPGSEGLLFLPHLTGERCPYPDPTASGAWIGLTTRHTRAHMARAILEGVAMTMARILGIMRSIGVPATAGRLGGGGTRSPLWREILTAALDIPTQEMETEEGPALGAALLAGVGAGVWPGVAEACEATIRARAQVDPNPSLARRYREMAEILDAGYQGLRGPMASLARIR